MPISMVTPKPATGRMLNSSDIAVIGAGPYGLSIAAHPSWRGIGGSRLLRIAKRVVSRIFRFSGSVALDRLD